MIGATFTKFGGAPTTLRTFMALRDLSVRRGISTLQQHHDLLDDTAESSSVTPPRLGGTLSPDEPQLRRHILGALEENEPTGLTQVSIDRTDLPAERAVDGDVQRRGLPVHGAAATDNQVRVPN